jgi:WD40 repeat protein
MGDVMMNTHTQAVPAVGAWFVGVGIVCCIANGVYLIPQTSAETTTDNQQLAAEHVAPPPHHITDIYGDPLPAGATARLGSLRLRHLGLTEFQLLPDDKSARTIGRDGFIRTWNLLTGTQVSAVALEGKFGKANGLQEIVLPGEEYRVPDGVHITFSPDQRFLAATFGHQVVIWDAETGRELKKLNRQDGYLALRAFSPDGAILAVVSHDGVTLLEWQKERLWPIKPRVAQDVNGFSKHQMLFTPDARRLIVWNDMLRVVLFSVDDLRVLYTLNERVTHLAVSPDSKVLALSLDTGDIVLIDLETGKERTRINRPLNYAAVTFSPDSKTLAISDRADTKDVVRLLDPTTGKALHSFELQERPTEMTFSPDGKTLACQLYRAVALVDIKSHRQLHRLEGRVSRLVFSQDTKLLVGTHDWEQRLRVWDLATGQERHTHPSAIALGSGSYSDPIPDLAVAQDGKVLAVGDRRKGCINLWHLSDSQLIRQLTPEYSAEWRSQIVFSPAGETLGVCDREGGLRYIDSLTGEVRRVFHLEFPRPARSDVPVISSYWISRDLKRAATARLTRTTQLLIRTSPMDEITGQVAFPGEVCAWSWPNIAVWMVKPRGEGLSIVSAETGRIRVHFPGYYVRRAPVVFSPDGRLLAALEEGYREVTVRETATGRTVAKLRTGPVLSFAIAPDNRTLVTADARGLQVWDLATGKQRRPRSTREPQLGEIAPICRQVVLTPDGQRAITDVIDGTGLVWDLNAFPTEALTQDGSVNVVGWWADLAKDDAATAYAAMWRFSELSPEAGVQFLRDKLKPAVVPDAIAIQQVVSELASNDFSTREQATVRLVELGSQATHELAQAARTSESPETRKRALEILNKTADPIPKGDTLRTLRAIAILERTEHVEARKVLLLLAGGGAWARETDEAKAALGRFKLRGGKL